MQYPYDPSIPLVGIYLNETFLYKIIIQEYLKHLYTIFKVWFNIFKIILCQGRIGSFYTAESLSCKLFEASLSYCFFIYSAELKTSLTWHILGVSFAKHELEARGSRKREQKAIWIDSWEYSYLTEKKRNRKDMVEFWKLELYFKNQEVIVGVCVGGWFPRKEHYTISDLIAASEKSEKQWWYLKVHCQDCTYNRNQIPGT